MLGTVEPMSLLTIYPQSTNICDPSCTQPLVFAEVQVTEQHGVGVGGELGGAWWVGGNERLLG